ncbi:MAG TPA: VOC family protein [Terriglobales bacterium]|jgi:PhnB protein
MSFNSYLNFNGDCEAALKAYEKCFGGKLEATTFGSTPAGNGVPADWQNKLVHARLTSSQGILMASDVPPGRYSKPQGFRVNINTNDPAEAERVFKELSQEATIEMALQQTFWAKRFAMLTDRFGTPWMINCE